MDGAARDGLSAAAAFELGLGALGLHLREFAEYALTIARDTAREVRNKELLAKVEAALDKLDYYQAAAVAQRRRRPVPTRAGDLAAHYVTSLNPSVGTSAGEN